MLYRDNLLIGITTRIQITIEYIHLTPIQITIVVVQR